MPIDTFSDRPVYQQIADELRTESTAGGLTKQVRRPVEAVMEDAA
jgi:DNA-binding transcriptional regulator YhcF (GntR family)